MTPSPEKGTYYAHPPPPLSLDCSVQHIIKPLVGNNRRLSAIDNVMQRVRSVKSWLDECRCRYWTESEGYSSNASRKYM